MQWCLNVVTSVTVLEWVVGRRWGVCGAVVYMEVLFSCSASGKPCWWSCTLSVFCLTGPFFQSFYMLDWWMSCWCCCSRMFTGWMPFLSPNQQCRSTEGWRLPMKLRWWLNSTIYANIHIFIIRAVTDNDDLGIGNWVLLEKLGKFCYAWGRKVLYADWGRKLQSSEIDLDWNQSVWWLRRLEG